MASKHDEITRKEFKTYQVDDHILKVIHQFEESHPGLDKEEINVLDWGCGRGRTVLKLLEMGYSAYGIDIDEVTMKNGYSMFEMLGYIPQNHIMHISSLKDFPDNFFHIITSEQVFEHVEDIRSVIEEQGRLTAPGGLGFHSFPASKMIVEVHLKMPLVHWFPKKRIRRYWIAFMMLLSYKPETKWPETVGKSFWETVDIYYDYLHRKTYYRDIRTVIELFQKQGFSIHYMNQPSKKSILNLLPEYYIMNGFALQSDHNIIIRKERTENDEDDV